MHAVRILIGGVFDRFPKAKMILGHNGENIPFSAWRLQHWMEFNPGNDRPKKRMQDYLRDNVYTTISGDSSVPALLCTMQVMGAQTACCSRSTTRSRTWTRRPSSWTTRPSASPTEKLAHKNACKLFRLPTPSNIYRANRSSGRHDA
jgi:2,3-dihydroxybenzoate decarboxylase